MSEIEAVEEVKVASADDPLPPETQLLIENIMTQYPKLDYLMAYLIATTPVEKLKTYLCDKKEIPKDFAERCKVTIEKGEAPKPYIDLETINEEFSKNSLN